jgi:hypothetical protein
LPSLKQLQDEAESREREGLSNPVSLSIFMLWMQFGGAENGLTLDDIMNQPAWLLHDFAYINGVISKERRRRPKKERDKPTTGRRRSIR